MGTSVLRRPSTAVAAMECLALAVCVFATTMPWLHAGLGDDPRVFTGSDLAPLAWALRAICALTAGAMVVAACSRHSAAARPVAVAGAACAALLTSALIGVLETVA